MSQLSPRTPERLTVSYPPPQSLSPTAKAAARQLHYSPAAGALSPRHHQQHSHHISLQQPWQPHRRAFLRRPSTYVQLCLLLVVTLCFHSLWVGKSLWFEKHPEGVLSRSAEQASVAKHDYAQPRHLRATDKASLSEQQLGLAGPQGTRNTMSAAIAAEQPPATLEGGKDEGGSAADASQAAGGEDSLWAADNAAGKNLSTAAEAAAAAGEQPAAGAAHGGTVAVAVDARQKAAVLTEGRQPAAVEGSGAGEAALRGAVAVVGRVEDGVEVELPNPLGETKGERKGRPLNATLPAPIVLPGSADACAQALRIPKVALLFLTSGELFHEQTWRLWFKSAAGALPASVALGSACSPKANTAALPVACGAEDGSGDEISQQHLFSVYVHAPPSFTIQGVPTNVTEYPEGSLWRGWLVEHRVHASWGNMSLVEAARNLMWEAYKDPLNQRFLLLSESDLPLYDPLTLYSQLASETKSRVESCLANTMPERWTPEMLLPNMNQSHWRKSSLWTLLQRDHVKVVLEDQAVFRKFEEWCFKELNTETKQWRSCIPDEHYIATLLAGVHNLTDEMHCSIPTSIEWGTENGQPKEYTNWAVSPNTFARLRNPELCNASTAQNTARSSFVALSDVVSDSSRKETCAALKTRRHSFAPMHPKCHLLTRKWPLRSAGPVYRMFLDCGSGLGLLDTDVCLNAGPFKAPPLQGRPLTAKLPPPLVEPASNDTCAQALQIPKVALLFLTKGPIFHEPTWRLWFKSAAGVLPATSVFGSACGPAVNLTALNTACIPPNTTNTIAQQHLYSVYIHAPPTFGLDGKPADNADYPDGSLWYGHLVQHRVYTSWGSMNLVEATRSLLWEAFRDPLNSRFLLLSESDIPLYDPLTMYTQLMSERKSRVENCRHRDSMISRWTDEMKLPNMDHNSWRKSSQWFMLVREHASVVLEDQAVFRKFEEWCFLHWVDEFQEDRDCFADEHYIPTLLGGVHGLGHQLQCNSGKDGPLNVPGGVSATDWSESLYEGHPKEYSPHDITPRLIDELRNYVVPCDAKLVHRLAQSQFVSIKQALGADPDAGSSLGAQPTRSQACALSSTLPKYDHALSDKCYLTARKFPKSTSSQVYNLFTSCDSGLRLLSRKVCRTAHKQFKRLPNPHTAVLLPPEAQPASSDACSQALRIPRVALLFLTRGHLHHEQTWRLWFKSAAGVLPAASVLKGACSKAANQAELLEACTPASGANGDEISQQHLFSVYIHAPPDFALPGLPTNVTEYPEGSLWRGHLIQRRLYTYWGSMSLVEATRSLLWEAFRDPLNSRFLLLSESDIPLYDPLTLYTQVMAEKRSRVQNCRLKHSSIYRFSDDMKLGNLLTKQTWRKSSQWFSLQRSHVHIILSDEEIYRRFEEWCWADWDEYKQTYKDCYPDEHYIPTLLGGVHDLGHQMLCGGGEGATLSAVDWREMVDGHPKSYEPEDVSPELVSKLRSFYMQCNGTTQQEQARAHFVPIQDALGAGSSAAACAMLAGGLPPYTTLSDKCYLTARKFPQRTADVVQQLFMSQCGEGLQLLTEGACTEGEGQPEADALAMGSGAAAAAGGGALGVDEA